METALQESVAGLYGTGFLDTGERVRRLMERYGGVVILPSVLGYETGLKKNIRKIAGIVEELGPGSRLHVDVMRRPFTERDAFSSDDIRILCGELGDCTDFDFHIMAMEPEPVLGLIDNVIPDYRKPDTMITIHREACREAPPRYVWLCPKEHDLLKFSTGSRGVNRRIRKIYTDSSGRIAELMKTLWKRYNTGIALEPGTCLENLSAGGESMKIHKYANRILIMAVESGKGGQGFIPGMEEKVAEAHRLNAYKEVQVDGGINEQTLPLVISAGADGVVIGSYITGAADPVMQARKARGIIDSMAYSY